MPQQDTSHLKEKIISILRLKGPSLPVHIARETGLSILFSSAFLSELISDKTVKISYMRVGSSPVYFLPGHSNLLERFSQHLKSKEKDAFELLKAKKFLKDNELDPAIRVALRAIKDFAIPFENQGELFWRYFIIPESEFKAPEKMPEQVQPKPEKINEISVPLATKLKIAKEEKKEKQKDLNILDRKPKKEKIKLKKTAKKPSTNEKFFNKIKEFLAKKSIEILGIESFSKDDLFLKVKYNDKEKLLVAYNKKKINEADISKAYKKSSELSLPYIILSVGEPSKKLQGFIEATKNLDSIEKIE